MCFHLQDNKNKLLIPNFILSPRRHSNNCCVQVAMLSPTLLSVWPPNLLHALLSFNLPAVCLASALSGVYTRGNDMIGEAGVKRLSSE